MKFNPKTLRFERTPDDKEKAKRVPGRSGSGDIIYVDGRGNVVEPKDMEEGKTYYVKSNKR